MRQLIRGIIALAGGVIITMLTGLVDVTPPDLMGARWFGFPVPWLYRMIVAPQYFPWVVEYMGLVIDVVVWIAVAALAVWFVTWPRKERNTPQADSPQA